jgi:hypothetical protein
MVGEDDLGWKWLYGWWCLGIGSVCLLSFLFSVVLCECFFLFFEKKVGSSFSLSGGEERFGSWWWVVARVDGRTRVVKTRIDVPIRPDRSF